MRVSSESLMYKHRGEVMASMQKTGLKISDQSLEVIAGLDRSGSSSYLTYCTSGGGCEDVQTYILYQDIIWCQPLGVNDDSRSNVLEITYVNTKGNTIKPVTLHIQIIDYDPMATVESLSHDILQLSYRKSIVKPRILLLVNPISGQGQAKKIYQKEILPILQAARAPVTYIETKFAENAVEIGRSLHIDEFDVIACCSGDGIPHEIINGLYQREDRLEAFKKLAITQLPCGSGNSLSLSTHGTTDASTATFRMLKANRVKMDIMAVTQNSLSNEQITKLSFLSQSYGVIADADIGTEHLRWLGPLRFDLGVAHKIFARTVYSCDLYVNFVTNSKSEISTFFDNHDSNVADDDGDGLNNTAVTEDLFKLKGGPLTQNPPSNWKLLDENISKNINVLYVGKMPYISKDVQFFPAAIPNDGAMDMVICTTDMSVLEAVRMFNKVEHGKHVFDDKVLHTKIKGYRLVPRVKNPSKHYISVDGESFPFEPLQVEIIPSLLTILTQDGNYVLTSFRK